jgi:hypothetical protein
MTERYRETTVVVRIPRHDGVGATAVEGLFHGRHVLYNYELAHTRIVQPPTADVLVTALGELLSSHATGGLRPNVEGRNYAVAEFDEATLGRRLAALIERSHERG